MEPKVNEVWETKSGRIALLVKVTQELSGTDKDEVCMLWWDEIDKEFVVAECMNRLNRKIGDNPNVFWMQLVGSQR